MAQLIVRNLEDDVRDRLRELAAAHGRSMEEEVREILRAAVHAARSERGEGLGTALTRHFDGVVDDAVVIEELRGHPARPPEL